MNQLMIRSLNGRYRKANKAEVLEVSAQYLAAAVQKDLGKPMQSPQAVKIFLLEAIGTRDSEVFCAIFLNNRHQMIAFEELFRGTIDGCSVYPREVVKRALELNASAVIFAHNHPSGVAMPSQADELITQRLKEALALIDVRVLDHLVIGTGQVSSFAENGYL